MPAPKTFSLALLTGLMLALLVLPATSGAGAKHKLKYPHMTIVAFANDSDPERKRTNSVAAELSYRVPAGASLKRACKGRVSFTITRRGKTLKRLRANMRIRSFDHSCTGWKDTVLPMNLKGRNVKMRVKFSGNTYYAAFDSASTISLPAY